MLTELPTLSLEKCKKGHPMRPGELRSHHDLFWFGLVCLTPHSPLAHCSTAHHQLYSLPFDSISLWFPQWDTSLVFHLCIPFPCSPFSTSLIANSLPLANRSGQFQSLTSALSTSSLGVLVSTHVYPMLPTSVIHACPLSQAQVPHKRLLDGHMHL